MAPFARRRRRPSAAEHVDGIFILGDGKTTACLHFLLEGARRDEPGLIATFHESPPRLVANAAAVGLDRAPYVNHGLIRILWHAPPELLLDAWNREVLSALEQHRPKRFVIDGVTDLQRLTAHPDRLSLSRGAHHDFSSRGATTLLSAEATTVVRAPLDLPIPTLAATVENAMLLRALSCALSHIG